MQRKVLIKDLLKEGRFEILNAGNVMNDEAASYYEDIIDQMTLGHRWVKETFEDRLAHRSVRPLSLTGLPLRSDRLQLVVL